MECCKKFALMQIVDLLLRRYFMLSFHRLSFSCFQGLHRPPARLKPDRLHSPIPAMPTVFRLLQALPVGRVTCQLNRIIGICPRSIQFRL